MEKNIPKIDEIISSIQNWATAALKNDDIKSVHLFGSLVYLDGVRFDAQVSDVDLLIVLDKKCEKNFSLKVSTLRFIFSKKEELEGILLKLLKRKGDKSISSFVVASPWELAMAIHKDRSPSFYCDTEFLDLSSRKRAPVGKQMSQHIATSDALAAVQGAQKFRNAYLTISANGERLDPPRTEGSPFPKELLRAAAQLSYAQDPTAQSESKFDINKGLVYLARLIGQSYPRLHEDLGKRIGGRGVGAEDEWEVQLEYWEALAQTAEDVLEQPSKNIKDKLIEHAILSNSFFKIDPWLEARSKDEYDFKRSLRDTLPLSNKLIDNKDYIEVTQCWAPLLKNPRFDPMHDDWRGRPFFVLAIQGALIDLSYAHMHLIGEKAFTNHLSIIYWAIDLILSAPPYAVSGPSESTLTTEDAIYGNKCYLNYLDNLDRFFDAWPPTAARMFCENIPADETVKAKVLSRRFEIKFIMRGTRE